jgi:hypothetical protein
MRIAAMIFICAVVLVSVRFSGILPDSADKTLDKQGTEDAASFVGSNKPETVEDSQQNSVKAERGGSRAALDNAGSVSINTKKPESERKSKTRCVSTEKSGVQLSVCLPETAVVGSEITCRVTLINVSKKTIAFDHSQWPPFGDFDFKIESAWGSVRRNKYGDLLMSEPPLFGRSQRMDIEPGSSISSTYNMTRFFDMSMSGSYLITVNCTR